MKEGIKCIADHYGYKHQREKLFEEMAELTVEICHLDERGDFDDYEQRQGVYEEIADVEVVLEEIKHLLNCRDEVEAFKEYKVKRQLERIRDGRKGA